jgi:hypothetical protein
MVEPVPRLRVVGEGEPPPRGRRGPGIAVILVLVYALAFLGALFLLWGQVRRRAALTSAPAAPAAPRLLSLADRRALASGEGLAPAARAEYERALSAALCDCGCGRKLAACLVGDQKCSRSPELAETLRQKFR